VPCGRTYWSDVQVTFSQPCAGTGILRGRTVTLTALKNERQNGNFELRAQVLASLKAQLEIYE
ncbi:hypothetical protein PIB30_069954, partial [Stylosanthes scabra]|nr:hypothetical protein [Stylosanthes scabra]